MVLTTNQIQPPVKCCLKWSLSCSFLPSLPCLYILNSSLPACGTEESRLPGCLELHSALTALSSSRFSCCLGACPFPDRRRHRMPGNNHQALGNPALGEPALGLFWCVRHCYLMSSVAFFILDCHLTSYLGDQSFLLGGGLSPWPDLSSIS